MLATYSVMTHKGYHSATTLGIATLGITTLGIMTFNITIDKTQHSI
jgi:hypothetical protein